MPSSTDEWTQSPKFASESSRNSPVPTCECARASACVWAGVRLHASVRLHTYVGACVCMRASVRACACARLFGRMEEAYRRDLKERLVHRSLRQQKLRRCLRRGGGGRRDGEPKCDGAGHGPIYNMTKWRSQCGDESAAARPE